MRFYSKWAARTARNGMRFLLTITSPLQSFLDRPGIVHEFCNRQALTILHRDGFTRCASFIGRYIKELNEGVYWADADWKNVSHYLRTGSKKGLWRFPSAVSEFNRYFSQALDQVRQGDCAKAIFFLGAAAHLVQDLCVPHHARGKVRFGHKKYENWVRKNYLKYSVDRFGIYHSDWRTSQGLLLNNAAVSADFLNWVVEDSGEVLYHNATAVLLPMAQRTTAGLFLQFFTAAEAALPFLNMNQRNYLCLDR